MEIAVTLLTPIVTALLGIVGLVIGDWSQRRTQVGRRKLALEDARRRVSFAVEWWNARKVLADSAESEQQAAARAVAWLEEGSALVAGSELPSVEEKPRVSLHRLLLVYPHESRAARVIRGSFHVVLGLVPIWVVGAVLKDILYRPDTEYLFTGLVIIVALVVLAMSIRS